MKKTPNKSKLTAWQKTVNRRKMQEAKARRKVNEDWQRVEATKSYRKAVAYSACRSTTDRIADEVLDGIFLNFRGSSSDKSASVQKRILRRIVEKRQAQAIHAKTRRSCDREAEVAIITNSGKCMESIHRLRFAI